MERRRREAAAGAIEGRDRGAAKDVAIAATISDQLACTQNEYDAFEIRVAAHRQRAGHNQKSRAARERAIAIDKREHAARSRVSDGCCTAEIPIERLCLVLQPTEIRARFVGGVEERR